MKKLEIALSFYSLILALIITLGAPTQFLFYPVFLFLLFEVLGRFWKVKLFNKGTLKAHLESFLSSFAYKTPFPLLKTLALYYSFILTAIMVFAGFLSAGSFAETISSFLFLPIALYFTIKVLPKRGRAITIHEIVITPQSLEPLKKQTMDKDRRMFLKLIGSAGITVFMFSLFTKKAHAAFFGSVPGPGTVAIKDTSGNPIDPAEKQPTDGYKIAQRDETSDAPNTYYGFTNKDGAWFIMLDDGSGNYRYTKGTSDFTNATTGWPNRINLTYGYFDDIF